MPDPKSKATKRTTPKRKASGKSQAKPQTKRYTPPQPVSKTSSPQWVPVTMFAFLVCGTAIVILNYLGLLPGAPRNSFLFLGLAEITAGFVFATLYR